MESNEQSVPEILELAPDAPGRPPDWRSRLLELLPSVSHASRMSVLHVCGKDAPIVYLIWAKYQLFSRRITSQHPELVALDGSRRKFGVGISEAESFRLNSTNWQRTVVEAWLLTGLSDEDISKRTGLSSSTIRWHERLFFNCRDWLGYDSLIGHSLTNEFAENPSPEDLLRQIAYRFGADCLEFAIRFWHFIIASKFDRNAVSSFDGSTVASIQRLWSWAAIRRLPLLSAATPREVREYQHLSLATKELQRLSSVELSPPIISEDEIRAEFFRRGMTSGNTASITRRRKMSKNALKSVRKHSA